MPDEHGEMPSELEYVSDFQAQDNFKQSFKRHLDRCLILMINDPVGSFELALAGLDVMLDYYKDETYLDDMNTIMGSFTKSVEVLSFDERKGVNTRSKVENARFTSNISRFRCLMRLAGRSSFLPFPPVAVAIGGKNPEFMSDELLSSSEIADVNAVIDKKLEDVQNISDKSIGDLKNKKPGDIPKEGALSDSAA